MHRVVVLCVISSYWIIPALKTGGTTLDSFTQADLQAFQTASDAHLGTLGNVLSLYGFWGEHEHWATYFISPKSDLGCVDISGVSLGDTHLSGVYMRPAGKATALYPRTWLAS